MGGGGGGRRTVRSLGDVNTTGGAAGVHVGGRAPIPQRRRRAGGGDVLRRQRENGGGGRRSDGGRRGGQRGVPVDDRSSLLNVGICKIKKKKRTVYRTVTVYGRTVPVP